jgi:hypothetical protein
LKLNKGATLIQIGEAADPATTTVHLRKGWNWLGYIPTVELSIETALSGLNASNGDRLTCQDAFVEYKDGSWSGSFNSMKPGEGYMYQSGKETDFVYSVSTSAGARSTVGAGDLEDSQSLAPARVASQEQPESPWQYDAHLYPDVTTIIAQVSSDDTTQQLLTLAAFCGDECRGIGKWVGDKLFITVHGTCGQGETITFQAYDSTTDETLSVSETITFEGQSLGSLDTPMLLHIGNTVTGISDIPASSVNGTKTYDLQGRSTFRHNRGMTIVVELDGTVKKRIVEQ